MARPKLDPSGLDSKAPKERIAVFVQYPIKLRYEAIWENEKAAAGNQNDFPGFGSWLGQRLEMLLDAEEAGYKYSQTQNLPNQNQAGADVVVIPDTERLATEILKELRPELSDVLRRSAFSAMQKVGETLGQAMTEAVERGIAGSSGEVSEHAARMATLALTPEIRKLTAAVNALSAPAEIYERTTH